MAEIKDDDDFGFEKIELSTDNNEHGYNFLDKHCIKEIDKFIANYKTYLLDKKKLPLDISNEAIKLCNKISDSNLFNKENYILSIIDKIESTTEETKKPKTGLLSSILSKNNKDDLAKTVEQRFKYFTSNIEKTRSLHDTWRNILRGKNMGTELALQTFISETHIVVVYAHLSDKKTSEEFCKDVSCKIVEVLDNKDLEQNIYDDIKNHHNMIDMASFGYAIIDSNCHCKSLNFGDFSFAAQIVRLNNSIVSLDVDLKKEYVKLSENIQKVDLSKFSFEIDLEPTSKLFIQNKDTKALCQITFKDLLQEIAPKTDVQDSSATQPDSTVQKTGY